MRQTIKEGRDDGVGWIQQIKQLGKFGEHSMDVSFLRCQKGRGKDERRETQFCAMVSP